MSLGVVLGLCDQSHPPAAQPEALISKPTGAFRACAAGESKQIGCYLWAWRIKSVEALTVFFRQSSLSVHREMLRVCRVWFWGEAQGGADLDSVGVMEGRQGVTCEGVRCAHLGLCRPSCRRLILKNRYEQVFLIFPK